MIDLECENNAEFFYIYENILVWMLPARVAMVEIFDPQFNDECGSAISALSSSMFNICKMLNKSPMTEILLCRADKCISLL